MNGKKQTRRHFLQSSSAVLMAGATLCAGRTGSSQEIQSQRDASQIISGKDRRLLVLVDSPAVLETPLSMLRDPGLTAVDRLFVRNNQQPDNATTLEPLPRAGWKIELSGLLNRNVSFDAAELESLEQTEYEMVLQCSGNSRSLFSATSQTKGTQWGRGGVGCVRFGGVLVSKVLEKLGIEPNEEVRFVAAEGSDNALPEQEDFEHSLPVAEVLNRSMIALTLNGKPLPAIHGGPVRLVTPGVYATMNMKWLSRLRFDSDESKNYHHLGRYRVPLTSIKPGSDYDFTLENSSYNWAMKVKTVVLSPEPDERVTGQVSVEGVAFNDGTAAIETVLVSTDRGATWQQAKLDASPSPYGWTRFRHDVRLAGGKQSVWTRAVDALGRSQPIDGSIVWNPRGYEWNGVEKIDFNVA